MDTVFTDANGMACAGQIVDLLRNDHDHAGAKATVLSLMDELGVRAKRMAAFETTTIRDAEARTAPATLKSEAPVSTTFGVSIVRHGTVSPNRAFRWLVYLVGP